MAISLKETAQGAFNLMQQQLTEFWPELNTWYAADWCSGPVVGAPSEITITDHFGAHKVSVAAW